MTNQHNIKPPQIFRLMIMCVIIGFISGILLIGIPGALVLELIELAYPYFGLQPLELSGDSVWPIAIMISLLWPVAIIPLSIFHFKIFPHQSLANRWIFSLIGSMVLTVVVTFIFFRDL